MSFGGGGGSDTSQQVLPYSAAEPALGQILSEASNIYSQGPTAAGFVAPTTQTMEGLAGQEALARQSQQQLADTLSGNFTNYTKAPQGAFGPIEGTAIGVKDQLVTAAEEFAANSGDQTIMNADQAIKIVSYLADKAEQFTGNDDLISYYLKSIPEIALPLADPNKPGEQIKNLRFAVQFAYNKNNARGR